MTSGSLLITAINDRRKLLLHTYHTAQDIPLVIDSVVPMVAMYMRWINGKKLDDILSQLNDNAAYDKFDYITAAAGLIIAARHNFLVPIPESFQEDIDIHDLDGYYSYRLVIGNRAGVATQWTLFGQGKELWSKDMLHELAEAIVDTTKKQASKVLARKTKRAKRKIP